MLSYIFDAQNVYWLKKFKSQGSKTDFEGKSV